jgi:hypothetical protein
MNFPETPKAEKKGKKKALLSEAGRNPASFRAFGRDGFGPGKIISLDFLGSVFNNQGKSDDCLRQSSDSLNAIKTKVSEVKTNANAAGTAFMKTAGWTSSDKSLGGGAASWGRHKSVKISTGVCTGQSLREPAVAPDTAKHPAPAADLRGALRRPGKAPESKKTGTKISAASFGKHLYSQFYYCHEKFFSRKGWLDQRVANHWHGQSRQRAEIQRL